jgi:Domain of unknown function (DUF4912)
MQRAELERLSRADLISEAEALGVTRANILTRPELIDELLVRTAPKDDKTLPRTRGFFGRARDLVARVIEKGLHLPETAERLRRVTLSASELAAKVAPAVVPSLTLAEIYAAQGYKARAVETLRRVVELEPDHAAAKALLAKLETAGMTVPPAHPPEPEEEPTNPDLDASASTSDVAAVQMAPVAPSSRGVLDGSQAEPMGFLDDEPLPVRYDVDECVAIAVDPSTLYVYWEVRDATLEHLRRMRPAGSLVLRLLVITPSWDGPTTATRDLDVASPLGDMVVRDLPGGAVVRAGIGWRIDDVFMPVAHAASLETPPGAPCPVKADSFVRWTKTGIVKVTRYDADYASIGRALGRLGASRERALGHGPHGAHPTRTPFASKRAGSSEAMI